MDRRISYSLVVLMISFIAFRLLGYLIVPLKTQFLTDGRDEIYAMKNIITALEILSFYGFNIIVGVVLVRLTKNVGFQKVLWLFMGCVFGFSSLILFFILEMRTQNFYEKD